MNRFTPALQEHVARGPYDLEELIDRDGVLSICLRNDEGASVTLHFDAYLTYRKIDEGDALVMLDQISSSSALGLGIYVVDNSDFFQWFVNQCHGIRANDSITHYTIATVNDVIDVLSLAEPAVDLE